MSYSNRAWYDGMVSTNGTEYAVRQLIGRLDEWDQLYESRFFHKMPLLNDQQEVTGYRLRKVPESYVSSAYDLADCNDEHLEFLYDEDGTLYPVTVGEMSRQEMGEHDIVYGSANLIANGKVVGAVIYTDH